MYYLNVFKKIMVKQIRIRGFDNNFSYFVGDKASKEIAIVDPDDADLLLAEINHGNYVPKMVLITHSHFDHVGGVAELVRHFQIPVYMHKNAENRVDIADDQKKTVKDGDIIKVGELEIKVLHTPGHIDDAVCYYIPKDKAEDGVPKLLTGDTLFVEGCGRADLSGSNVEDLYKTLQKLKKLPDETKVYPGHDYGSKPVSTIGWEKEHNRYFLCKDFDEFESLRT
ncbi:MBL fold metallo-hydrolase [Patescibacteria group bacterium]